LRRLYDFMDRQLVRSNIQKAPEGVRDTLRRLTTLRNAWAEMLRRQETDPHGSGPFEALAEEP
jgi:flagellin-specific chaperone FliS